MSSPPASAASTRPQHAGTARTLQRFRDWKAGDERAGETLFHDLQLRLRAYFRGQPSHVLDDLVQETLVACVVTRESLRCDDALLGYVYAVARRVLVRHLQSKALPVVTIDEDPADDKRPAPDHVVDARRLLYASPTPSTLLVVRRYVEGQHGVDLARELRISEASLRRRVRRGLAELRRTASELPYP
jgi:DNA-directed RNA polymerase specialized sigma24 family protein